MKAMTIGINPEYNYPGSLSEWSSDNTYYASNFGGSLITRAIMREFNADYIHDFSDIASLKNNYDTCILSFATHAHSRRDVSRYADVVEKLQMRTIVLSLGMEDFLESASSKYALHDSVRRILDIASDSSSWIGVRGPYTAHILQKNGYKDVLPVGCPTIYWNLKPEFDLPAIPPEATARDSLVVYHKSLAAANFDLLKDATLLGQDFQDQVIFTDKLASDTQLVDMESTYYSNLQYGSEIRREVRKNGIFPENFDHWFSTIGKQAFVFGPRLHGCIAALIQGVPAVMTPRDLRVREMVEVLGLPAVDYRELPGKTVDDLIQRADFSRFLQTYSARYENYCAFIIENGMSSNLQFPERPRYNVQTSDNATTNFLLSNQMEHIPTTKSEGLLSRLKRYL